jgi:hypothetical protein
MGIHIHICMHQTYLRHLATSSAAFLTAASARSSSSSSLLRRSSSCLCFASSSPRFFLSSSSFFDRSFSSLLCMYVCMYVCMCSVCHRYTVLSPLCYACMYICVCFVCHRYTQIYTHRHTLYIHNTYIPFHSLFTFPPDSVILFPLLFLPHNT